MIKASELRIGNLISFNGQICIVNEIDNQGVVVRFKKDNELESIDLFQFQSILLTEEWLFKFGFEETLNQYKKPTLLNKISCNNIPFIILFLDNHYQYDDLRFRTNIQYVHQLQNLYFALTGEELK